MRILRISTIFLLSAGMMTCSTDVQSECGCTSEAIDVSAVGTDGSEITLDSIKYTYENGPVETIKKDSNGTIHGLVGYDAGSYEVWVYYENAVSDTVLMNVEMGGPEDCRRPSTEKIAFKFENKDYYGKTVSNIGGCGE